jgi:hypothetical protein
LKGSKKILRYLIENPVSDIKLLCERKMLLEQYSIDIPQDTLDSLRDLEDSLPWIMNPGSTEDIKAAYNLVFFNNKLSSPLNHVPKALTSINLYKILVSPTIGLVSPIMYFIIPFLVLVFKFKVKVNFFSYIKLIYNGMMMGTLRMGSFQYVSVLLSLVFYFQGVFNSIEISKACYNVSKYISNNTSKVTSFLCIGQELVDKYWKEELNEYFFFDADDTKIDPIKKCNPFALFSDFGDSLKEFKYFSRDNVIPLIKQIYKLDTIFTICNIKRTYMFTYPEFIFDDKSPIFNVEGVYHPYLSNPVKNSINIGSPRNFILTGPNAGGKSTFIKSLLLNIVLSQSLVISSCESCSLTPFKYIASQINIPDCKGKESLFEAEMFRAKYTLDKLKECKGFSFIVLDEIFNSTNPIEGISGAFSIINKISSFEKNLSIVATHYLYLTRLEKLYPERFTNIKINLSQDEAGSIKFPYKISKGISQQYIALELLKKNGFDEDIINEALAIKSRFISKKKLS